MPITPENLGIPRASLAATASIEAAVNPALEQIAAIMAHQDQGPWSTIPTATAARKGMRYLVTSGPRQGYEYVCIGTGWLRVDAPPQVTTSLPVGADVWDGLEVLYRATTSPIPVHWHLRVEGGYWVPVGGQEEISFGSANGIWATQSSTWTATTTVIPSAGLVLPLAGRYAWRFGGASFTGPTGSGGHLLPGVAGAPLVSEERSLFMGPGATVSTRESTAPGTVDVAANATVKMLFRSEGGTEVGAQRITLAARPLRLNVS